MRKKAASSALRVSFSCMRDECVAAYNATREREVDIDA